MEKSFLSIMKIGYLIKSKTLYPFGTTKVPKN